MHGDKIKRGRQLLDDEGEGEWILLVDIETMIPIDIGELVYVLGEKAW